MQLPEIKGLTVVAIQQAVTAYYGVSMFELLSMQRNATIVEARHIAMWLSRRYTGRSYPQIGRMFGDRDHTTVMAACDRIDKKIGLSPTTRKDLTEIVAGLEAVVKRDVLARQHRKDVDPLQVAVDHLNNGTTPAFSPIESRLLLLVFVSYAMASGDVRDSEHPEVIEVGPPTPSPVVPPPTPLPTVHASALDLLVSRARAVVSRRANVKSNQFSQFEKSARESFEASLDALETALNILSPGKAMK